MNDAVTKIFWQPVNKRNEAPNEKKCIKLPDITEVRKGTDIDPITKPEVQERVLLQPTETRPAPLIRKQSLSQSMLNLNDSKNEVFYATQTLRRTAKTEELPLCISLILPDR